jgi:hypothetical protein
MTMGRRMRSLGMSKERRKKKPDNNSRENNEKPGNGIEKRKLGMAIGRK